MDTAAPSSVAIEVALGEALVRQSSGRHRAQAALGLTAAVPVGGRWGVAFEAVATGASERSAELALDQYLLRPAALATLSFRRPVAPVGRRRRADALSHPLIFDLALGPALALTLARWGADEADDVWFVEPAVRARAALSLGVAGPVSVRLQGGLDWRASGTDHDYLLGAAWSF